MTTATTTSFQQHTTNTTYDNYFNSDEFSKKYTVDQSPNGFLGSGGYGDVFTAYRNSDGKEVAVKLIYKKKVDKWVDTARGVKVPMECHLLNVAKHIDGVVKLHDVFDLGRKHFLMVMEKFEKCQDLFAYINDKEYLGEAEAKRIFRKVVTIAVELMKCKILHRDIKAENIVLNMDDADQVMLIDFGLGCTVGDYKNHRFDYHLGTQIYKPPELLLNNWYLGPQATVWTLGILLYSMTNGELPFTTNEEIVSGEFDFRVNGLSKACKHLITACLNGNFKKRLKLSKILNHSWFRQQ